MSQNRVVFLDRDGVINQDSPEFIKNWKEFFFIPGSIEAIRRLTSSGFDIIIITNQSGVGRKLFSLADLNEMHTNLKARIEAENGRIKEIFFCPHRPNEKCKCRKPLPEMVLKAQKKYNIDLSTAVMVGDSAKDIQCGRNAGVGKTILVETGNPRTALDILIRQGIQPDLVTANLFSASEWILANVH